ncbi:MAG: LCP family protein [Oscillospiraceae bacterium]|nr:LCP family protein [Oscillospiraceae bacterium]
MKNQKIGGLWNGLAAVLLGIVFLSEGLLLYWINRLKMLPTVHFTVLTAACVLISLILGLLLIRRQKGKWQKKQGFGRQVLACALSLVLIAGCVVGTMAVAKLYGTISAITSVNKINVLLEIYVPIDDPARYLQDTVGYTFALADTTEAEDAQKALEDLERVMGAPVSTVTYPTSFDIIDALYAGEVDAIILDSSYLSVLGSLDGYADYDERVRAIHEYVIEKEIVVQEPVQSSDTSTFLLYISGNDARMQLLADGGSDVNILAAVNPEAKQVLLVNTPRDYYVKNPAGNGARDKLSHCGLNGIQNCISAISGLYGHEIDYYARINFTGFQTLIDAVGGVTIHTDFGFKAGDYYIKKGENHLDGEHALAFARERKSLAGGDNDRGKNQMKLISALIDQLSASTLLANYAEILDSLEGMFSTSIPPEVISQLVQAQLKDMSGWDVLSFAVTGDGGSDSCWAVGGGYGYVMYPHEHMVDHASALIGRVLDGEVLTQDDLTVN